MYAPGFLLAYLLPLMLVASCAAGGLWLWAVPVFTLIVVPLLDLAVGENRSNPDPRDLAALGRRRFYRFAVYGWVPLQIGTVVAGASYAAQGVLDPLAWWGLTISVGLITGGIGITLAHELGHRHSRAERLLAQLLLCTVGYMHFSIEHNKGHHLHVATRRDPASARFGESFYAFLPRTILGGYWDAWGIEARRLSRAGRGRFGWRNRMFAATLLPIMLAAALGAMFGASALWFFVSQALLAVALLEAVNYIEHYGLVRRELAPGRHEPVDARHSWNSSHAVSNYFLFNLQRHSAHHLNANRRYQTLEHLDASPQLPSGYPGMIWLALIPPLWRRVMDRRLEYHRAPVASA